MSSITAYALIGLRIKKKDLVGERVETVRCCNEEHPPDFAFCPKTGQPTKPREKLVRGPIDGYDNNKGLLHGYKLVESQVDYTYVVEKRGDGQDLIVECDDYGECAGNLSLLGRDASACDGADLSWAADVMRGKLEPGGLWDSKNYGLHVVLHVG